MRPIQWRLLVAVGVALVWLILPASKTASAATPNPQPIEPTSGPPGTKTVLKGNPCAFEVEQFEPTFVWFSETNADGTPHYVAATELRRSDGEQRSFVVPDLPGGEYDLIAACDIPDGDGPTVWFNEFTVVPDTATEPQAAGGPPGGALLPALAAIVGALSWQWRIGRRRRPEGT